MNWHEHSPYHHHSDVLGRVHMQPLEKARIKREQRDRRINLACKVAIVVCAVTVCVAAAVWGTP